MKSLIFILFLTLSSVSIANTNTELFYIAQSNYYYELDDKGNDVATVFKTIHQRFDGDCEDFAYSLLLAMKKGKVYFTTHKGQGHAILLNDGIVYDPNYPEPIKVQDYPEKIVRVIDFFKLKVKFVNNERI